MKSFPSEYYDKFYYSTMKSNMFNKFVESRGRSLPGSDTMLDLVRVRPGMKLLDVGCGRGEKAMFLGSKGVDAYGIDYSETALQIGREFFTFYDEERLKNIHLIKGDVTELPFDDGYFDRVMSWSVLEHIYPWQQELLFSEIFRVLKPDGAFVFETHPCEWFERIGQPIVKPFKQLFLGRKMEDHEEREAINPEHVGLKNPVTLRRDLRRAGFACRVRLAKRGHFEADGGIARLLGVFLESIPVANMIFRNNIYGVSAKSKDSLERFDCSASEVLDTFEGLNN